MIIAFTGKAGSGKNTAASMVNFIVNGYSFKDWNILFDSNDYKDVQYSKDSFLKRLLQLKYNDFRFFSKEDIIKDLNAIIKVNTSLQFFEEKSFASKLKDICTILTGIPREDWDKRELRDIKLGIKGLKNPIIEDLKDVFVLNWSHNSINNTALPNYTYRTFMQQVGTEAMRDSIHQDVWVNALLKDYKAINYLQCIASEGVVSPIMPNWVITDLRFDNEALAIKERGGIIIKIERPDVETIKHSSEVGVDKKYIDHTVFNHDGFEDLYDVLEWLLSDYFPNEQ